ncbi:MAG TPA: hypothetical protein PLD20_34010 [Blastocatellia bacterium]|nr:hypothetical protein [Blastocatellia bacterium]HMY75857.1 hypothetical protein [Blastocatellia bacterium]HMZ22989.1 hypothetical protein [Blastocatellia bacterium]
MAHGKRRKSYRIHWGGKQSYTVNAKEFAHALAGGWVVTVTDRIAKIADGVRARLEDGALRLERAAGECWFIYTSWIAIERQAPHRGEYWERAILEDHCGPRVVPRDSGLPWWERCPGAVS